MEVFRDPQGYGFCPLTISPSTRCKVEADLAVLGVDVRVVLISPLVEPFEVLGGPHERIGKRIVEHVNLVRVRVRVRVGFMYYYGV